MPWDGRLPISTSEPGLPPSRSCVTWGNRKEDGCTGQARRCSARFRRIGKPGRKTPTTDTAKRFRFAQLRPLSLSAAAEVPMPRPARGHILASTERHIHRTASSVRRFFAVSARGRRVAPMFLASLSVRFPPGTACRLGVSEMAWSIDRLRTDLA